VEKTHPLLDIIENSYTYSSLNSSVGNFSTLSVAGEGSILKANFDVRLKTRTSGQPGTTPLYHALIAKGFSSSAIPDYFDLRSASVWYSIYTDHNIMSQGAYGHSFLSAEVGFGIDTSVAFGISVTPSWSVDKCLVSDAFSLLKDGRDYTNSNGNSNSNSGC